MADNNDKKLYLLDAFALIFRAYFAFSRNPLINSKGQNVSAVTGFVNTLYDLLKNTDSTHIAVCFDSDQAPVGREEVYADYKANREAAPEDIKWSVPIIKQIVEAFHIPILEVPGFEADDVVGTLAKKAEQAGYQVYMVTMDKDYGQLMSENIFMYRPSYTGKGFDTVSVTEMMEKWGIEDPLQLIDILGLMGDSVDNIPGVPGIGEKTAQKLIAEYGSVENVLANTDKMKGKLQENLRTYADQALMSKQLATIILDVPVEFNEEELVIEEPDKEKLAEIFAELEFRQLGKRILGDSYQVNVARTGEQIDIFGGSSGGTEIKQASEQVAGGKDITNTEHRYTLCNDDKSIDQLIKDLQKQKLICFDTETTGVDANEAELVGMSFSWEAGSGYYVPVPADRSSADALLNKFRPVLESEKIGKVAQNLKYDYLIMKWYGVELKGDLHDSMLAHYLLEPELRHNMDYLSENYLGYTPVSIETLIGKKGKNQLSMRDAPLDKVAEYAAEDADITLQLHTIFQPMLDKEELRKLYEDVEMPLVPVLAAMEYEGVNLDVDFLNKYSEELAVDIEIAAKEIYELAEVKFNIDSPKQLGEVLFTKMKIPYEGKKTKTGQLSTSEDILARLAPNHPIANHILEYRELNKLKSTYVDALPQLINPKTGRVHTNFGQAIAASGRLSSNNPNLQNIPIRTERGQRVRKAFIPRDEHHIILSADYSQIELRIIAALSNDEGMIEAFRQGMDIHSATAARVFGVALAEVNRDMRSKAKAVNFGIAYGQTAFGLSQNLGISRTEAKEIIDNYNEKFPGVARLMEENIEYARKHGYVKTVLGRKRYLRDINSANNTVRSAAERVAVNSPIQGSAADLIKVAMLHLHDAMNKRHMRSRMTLQVHDELVFDAHRDEVEELEVLVREKMVNALSLNVPIEAEVGKGSNWLEAH
ncbi:MAG TPA: DNA polymerase I [Chitinophagales bacterium]|nr:DNA polymerase I [Chitinophagales bacterium]HQU76767.1 DNA polymerase I [Chitinophagales bacterium]HRX24124.1 DNA polymerase I [Chitinophagales bacterium]